MSVSLARRADRSRRRSGCPRGPGSGSDRPASEFHRRSAHRRESRFRKGCWSIRTQRYDRVAARGPSPRRGRSSWRARARLRAPPTTSSWPTAHASESALLLLVVRPGPATMPIRNNPAALLSRDPIVAGKVGNPDVGRSPRPSCRPWLGCPERSPRTSSCSSTMADHPVTPRDRHPVGRVTVASAGGRCRVRGRKRHCRLGPDAECLKPGCVFRPHAPMTCADRSPGTERRPRHRRSARPGLRARVVPLGWVASVGARSDSASPRRLDRALSERNESRGGLPPQGKSSPQVAPRLKIPPSDDVHGVRPMQ